MKNEFNNKLTDKGWRSMRGALDREMPEKRRQRPLAWWWLSILIALPLAGAGGWWWYRSGKPEQTHTRPVEKETRRQPVVDAGSAETKKPIDINLQTERPEDASAPLSFSTARTVSTLAKNDTRNHTILTNNTLFSQPAEARVETLVSDHLVGEETVDRQGINFLASLPVKEQIIQTGSPGKPDLLRVALDEQDIIKKQPSPRRWSIGLTAGIHSESLSAVNGFSAGLALEWQPFQKWGLRSGIQYARYRPSLQERPVVSLDNTSYVDATGNFAVLQDVINPGTGNASADQAAQKVLVPVDRLQRLEMPLLAFWQPFRPLRLYAGMTASCNLSASASEQNFANNKIYVANSKIALENLNTLTSSTLPRWHANLLFGAGLRIGKRFELDAFYQPTFGNSGAANSADTTGSFNGGAYNLTSNPQSTDPQSHFFLSGVFFF